MNQNLAEKLPEGTYTYKEYLSWDTDEKYELFNGQAVMQARPSVEHQRVASAIERQLGGFLEGKKCSVHREIEVLFPAQEGQDSGDIRNVFIPDIIVVCEPEKIKKQHCLGAPTIAIEVLSPSTAKYDKLLKLNIYQNAGVPEYWVVAPQEQTVDVYLLENGLYRLSAVYMEEDTEAQVFSLEGCTIDMSKVFIRQEE